MNKILIALIASVAVFAASAQTNTGTAVKETAKATVETTKQGGQNVAAAMTPEPKKSMHKAKASMHKASAKMHRHNAKVAAKKAVN
jgi:hypothetical protein